MIGYLLLAPVVRLGIYLLLKSQLEMVDLWTFTRLDSIAIGCLMALLAFDSRWQSPLLRVGRAPAIWIIVPIVILAASTALSSRVAAYDVVLDLSVRAVCIAAIIWLVVSHPNCAVGRWLESRPFIAIGILSYSLYLWQQLFLNPHRNAWPTRWPLNLLFAVLAACASYFLIESPFLRLKRRKWQTTAR